ncbi:hypothetical protein [Stetteria hydrogenophila]
MEAEYRLAVRPSWIALGIPVPGAENPFLAVVYPEEVSVVFTLRECGGSGGFESSGLDGPAAGLLGQAASRLIEGLGGGLCVRAVFHGVRGWHSQAGLYAAASALLAYAVARWHGERPDVEEVMEIAGLADPEMPREWALAVEALRYASLEGSLAVYRGVDEKATLPGEPLGYRVVEAVKPGWSIDRERVGSSVYESLVRLAGSAVLTAAVMLREGESLPAVLEALESVEWGVAHAAWRVQPRPGCLPHPGLPGVIEVSCPPERAEAIHPAARDPSH